MGARYLTIPFSLLGNSGGHIIAIFSEKMSLRETERIAKVSHTKSQRPVQDSNSDLSDPQILSGNAAVELGLQSKDARAQGRVGMKS